MTPSTLHVAPHDGRLRRCPATDASTPVARAHTDLPTRLLKAAGRRHPLWRTIRRDRRTEARRAASTSGSCARPRRPARRAGRVRTLSRTRARLRAATSTTMRSIPSSLTPSPRSTVPSMRRAPIGAPSPRGTSKPAPPAQLGAQRYAAPRAHRDDDRGRRTLVQPAAQDEHRVVEGVRRRLDRAADDPQPGPRAPRRPSRTAASPAFSQRNGNAARPTVVLANKETE